MRKHFIFFLLGLALILTSERVKGTHIRAGEIIAARVSTSSLTYNFSIIGYTDTGSNVKFGGGEIDFGDGTVINIEEGSQFGIVEVIVDQEKQIAYNVFEIEHTFQAPGAYIVRFNEKNRNAGVLNMDNSVDTPFYIETRILIDPFLGSNNTPIFLVPPVDEAAVGVRFIHNPGAFDIDGDSLSYKLVVPKQFKDREVTNYFDPNDPKFYASNFSNGNEDQNGPPTFSIDAITGDLVWNSPGAMGEYNIAFIVEEWRKVQGEWFNLGYVTRDMQIIVDETDNNRPEIVVPDQICVEAGTLINETVIGVDQDGHQVKLEAFGGPFEFDVNPATFQAFPFGADYAPQPREGVFQWQTECNMVRKRPYDIQFKVTDFPANVQNPSQRVGPSLVDFKTLPITIYAPAPTGLVATVQTGRSISLTWDEYNCGLADQMQVWRRVDNFNFTPDDCNLGIPENGGYELIATVDSIRYTDENKNVIYRTGFLDDNDGQGLAPGANYCYRLVAAFPEPAGGESVVSEEVCDIILADAPVTTNVDIIKTDRSNGEIFIKWLAPFQIDQVQFPPPYKYKVFRSVGFAGNGEEVEVAFIDGLEFTDSGLNTVDLVYKYRIELYNNNGTSYVDSSSPASSVWLSLAPGLNSINLQWEAEVPWSNISRDHPYHRVYRNWVVEGSADEIVLIDSAEVTAQGLRFYDDGSFNDMELSQDRNYCYYIETKGGYGNPLIEEPFLNKSQLVCAEPNDMDPPCTPISFSINEGLDCQLLVETEGCSVEDYTNLISWELDLGDECEDDIANFDIYYTQSLEDEFSIVGANILGTQFSHEGLPSHKGYYFIRSVDRSGNSSTPSDTLVFDNCPVFELPNVFSPNGDGINDVFTPYFDVVDGRAIPEFANNGKCPKFIESLDFRVFDRSGGVIFNFESNNGQEGNVNNVLINWDGKTNSGIELPSGVYYYSADVTFDVLDQSMARKAYNGWVQILK